MQTALALLLSAATCLALTTASAHAAHVGCGSVLYEDTALDSNLTNCPADGLVIGADGVALKLNGFIISGSGTGHGVFAQNRNKVFIKGPGVIRGFVNGVLIIEGSRHQIRDVTTSNNTAGGIVVLDSHHNAIKGNASFSNGFTGIQMFRVSKTSVAANNVFDNETGIRLGNARDNELRHNNIHSNDLIGIRLEMSHDNHIEENALTGNNTGARLMDASNGNRLGSNVIIGNAVGVFIGSPGGNRDNKVTRNTVINNAAGVRIFDTSDINTRITKNTFSSNSDHIQDDGLGTIVEENNCLPADLSPVCN
jgi:parallel beta-helix repeat protein